MADNSALPQSPLEGSVLISCAKANASAGLALAAERSGYGQDIEGFRSALKQACEEVGFEMTELKDLITDQQQVKVQGGLEVAPDSLSDL